MSSQGGSPLWGLSMFSTDLLNHVFYSENTKMSLGKLLLVQLPWAFLPLSDLALLSRTWNSGNWQRRMDSCFMCKAKYRPQMSISISNHDVEVSLLAKLLSILPMINIFFKGRHYFSWRQGYITMLAEQCSFLPRYRSCFPKNSLEGYLVCSCQPRVIWHYRTELVYRSLSNYSRSEVRFYYFDECVFYDINPWFQWDVNLCISCIIS